MFRVFYSLKLTMSDIYIIKIGISYDLTFTKFLTKELKYKNDEFECKYLSHSN